MALLFGRPQRRVANLDGTYSTDFAGATAADLIPDRSISISAGLPAVNSETALRSSAVWACLRLRAGLISTFPVGVFRRANGVDGSQIELPKPPIFRDTGGAHVDFMEWRYSTQIDLDRGGNAFGLITKTSQYGLPAEIELMPLHQCSVRVRDDGRLVYRFGKLEYGPDEVYHEKQYTVAGLPVGLSPLAYAAWTIGEYLSVQDFAISWFGGGGVPRGHLRNRMQTMSPDTAAAVKSRFKSTVLSGDPFVSGADWEYQPLQAEQTGNEWLEAKRLGLVDICRYFNVPGDLVDAVMSGQSVTYANITQRNLQFLATSLGTTIAWRENAWNKLLPGGQYVKLNTDALLRMDPLARANMIAQQINARVLAPSEARALDEREPFTEKQLAEFDRLFGSKAPAPGLPAGSDPSAQAPQAGKKPQGDKPAADKPGDNSEGDQ